MADIGKRNTLPIIRESTPGLYLNGGDLGEILLPGKYIPPNLRQGATLDVFIYLDSEDRLVATTESPLAMVGEFAALRVVNLHPRMGAFLHWGLEKDLLLPFREQETPVRPGQTVVVFVKLDPVTKRLVATTRLGRHLSRETPAYSPGQKVPLMIVGESPLGYTALVDHSHLGLLYRDQVPIQLDVGQKIDGFIRTLRPGGKIDLALSATGYKRVAPLLDRIIEALKENKGRLPMDDSSLPGDIAARFGVSKNAFKLALAALYKRRNIRFTHPGIEWIDNSNWSPAPPQKPARPPKLTRPSRPSHPAAHTRFPRRPKS